MTLGLKPLWGQRKLKRGNPGLQWLCMGSRAWEGSRNRQRGVNSREVFIIRMDWSHDLEKSIKEEKLRSSWKRESSAPRHCLCLSEFFLLGRNGERVEGSLLRQGGVGQTYSVWPVDSDHAPRAKCRNGEQESGNTVISHYRGIHTYRQGLIY